MNNAELKVVIKVPESDLEQAQQAVMVGRQ